MLHVAVDADASAAMVGVAQLVEHLVVVQDVAGSSPVTHPKSGPSMSMLGPTLTSLACRNPSCPQLLVAQCPKTDARINASRDETLPNSLNMEPMLLRDLALR